MKTLMVATDFSERSDRALRRATLLARQFEATMLMVHVVDDDQPRRILDAERDEATTLLRQMAATLRDMDGVTCQTRVILASPFVGIAQAVADATPDLFVIGPHRRQVLRDVFIGTTAERTIRSVDCPVLMVNATPEGHDAHVLQTTGLSDGSRDALLRFQALGLAAHARTSLLHILDAPALHLAFSHSIPKDDQKHYLEDEQRDASRDLARFLSSTGLNHLRQIVRYEATPAPQEILKAAGEEHADLVVMSTHGRSGLAKMLIGSVTEQVLRTAQIDVLAIPPQRRAGRRAVLECQPDLSRSRSWPAERLPEGHEVLFWKLRSGGLFGAVSFKENLALPADLHEGPYLMTRSVAFAERSFMQRPDASRRAGRRVELSSAACHVPSSGLPKVTASRLPTWTPGRCRKIASTNAIDRTRLANMPS